MPPREIGLESTDFIEFLADDATTWRARDLLRAGAASARISRRNPALSRGRSVLIAAHGNSLRALIKFLDQVSDDDIVSREIPTGSPLVYELDGALRPLKHYYLGDPRNGG